MNEKVSKLELRLIILNCSLQVGISQLLCNFSRKQRANEKRFEALLQQTFDFQAPLIDERCSYDKLNEVAIIWKSNYKLV